MPLSPELEREIAEAGKVIAPYINRRKAQICTQAGSTASGGNPKTGAPTGRIWVKAEGNHMPIAAWNAVAFDGIVGAWVVVADDRTSGEPTIIEVLARENVQRGGALYASQIASGPQQSPTTQRPRHNYSAVTAPTVNDDESSSYSTNSLWVNTSTGTAYICTDASTGAAVWQVIGSGDFLADGTLPMTDDLDLDSNDLVNGGTVFTAALAVNEATPDASAIAEFTATDAGILIPRMTKAQRDLIATPASGLLVYNTDAERFNYYDGANWQVVGSGNYSTDNVSNPPTDAEIDTAFGTPASVGTPFVGIIDDGGADTIMWLVASNGTSWWYTSLTKGL